MSRDKRTGWLADLRVGDTVVVSFSRSVASLRRVERITPTGRLVVDGATFNHRGFRGGFGGNVYLLQATPECVAALRHERDRRDALSAAQRLVGMLQRKEVDNPAEVVDALQRWTGDGEP